MQSDIAVINLDDEYGRRLTGETQAKVYTFSTSRDEADFTAKSLKSFADGSTFAFVGSGIIARARIPMPGEFSVSNAMAAIACAYALGFPLEQIIEALADCGGVTGRCEVI
jgi:UDP-N-acetylmuramoyl-L-alanyl-D-glutamate--2,6-diaminopimelate ligase